MVIGNSIVRDWIANRFLVCGMFEPTKNPEGLTPWIFS